jgi:CRP/FNR family transcriptional regulator, cyclic AMP receptor protein
MSDAADGIETVEFAPGDYLFHEGEAGYHFYIIQSGEVEVFKNKPPSGKIPLAIVGSGTSLGEFAMIDKQPRSATARALTDVTAAKISEAAYDELLKDLPDWAFSVLTALVQRLRFTNEIVQKKGIVDEKLLNQIESQQLDASSTIADSSPYLRAPGNDDEDN